MNTEKIPGSANDAYSQFTGTDHYYQYMMGNVLTDGTMQLATDLQCFWILDIIASYTGHKKLNGEDIQVWKFTRKGDTCKVTCEDGNYNVLITKKIEFTDFPYDTVTFWKQQNVILLPSEY